MVDDAAPLKIDDIYYIFNMLYSTSHQKISTYYAFIVSGYTYFSECFTMLIVITLMLLYK